MHPGLEGLTGVELQASQEGVGGAQVGEDDLAGFSVDPAGGDDLPIAVAVDGLGGEASHLFSKYKKEMGVSMGSRI
jgi:hypothetical protein